MPGVLDPYRPFSLCDSILALRSPRTSETFASLRLDLSSAIAAYLRNLLLFAPSKPSFHVASSHLRSTARPLHLPDRAYLFALPCMTTRMRSSPLKSCSSTLALPTGAFLLVCFEEYIVGLDYIVPVRFEEHSLRLLPLHSVCAFRGLHFRHLSTGVPVCFKEYITVEELFSHALRGVYCRHPLHAHPCTSTPLSST